MISASRSTRSTISTTVSFLKDPAVARPTEQPDLRHDDRAVGGQASVAVGLTEAADDTVEVPGSARRLLQLHAQGLADEVGQGQGGVLAQQIEVVLEELTQSLGAGEAAQQQRVGAKATDHAGLAGILRATHGE